MIKMYARWLSFFANRFIAVSETVKQMLIGVPRRDSEELRSFQMDSTSTGIREKSELPYLRICTDLIRGRYPVLVSVGRLLR